MGERMASENSKLIGFVIRMKLDNVRVGGGK